MIEKIRTEEIRARAGVASTSEKIREARLRLLRPVERKDGGRCSIEKMGVGGHQKTGRRGGALNEKI